MKTLRLVVPIVFLAVAMTRSEAADVTYFLLGPAPQSPATNSFVLPLSAPEDIAHARALIAQGPNPGGEANMATVGAIVGGGRDGINRDFLNPAFPEWSWRVESAGFLDFSIPEIWYTAPAQLEALFTQIGSTGTVNAVFWNYAVVKELGIQPLFLSITPRGQNLDIYWSGLGTNYAYTLESASSPGGVNWLAVPGAAWPLNTNHWILPVTSADAQFFRVKAEAGVQAVAASPKPD